MECPIEYRITDRPPAGPITLRVTYTADLVTAGPDEVVSVARQRLATTVRNHTRIAANRGRTEVTVEITVSAPGPLLPYVFGQAQRAHTALAARLGICLDTVLDSQ